MRDTKTQKNRCLRCYHPLTAAMDIKADHIPKNGDLSICIKCGAVCAFTDNLTLRPLTKNEIEKISNSPEIMWDLRNAVSLVYFVQKVKNKKVLEN